MLGLLWNNIDFENKTVAIDRSRDYHGVRKPKTKNSKRTTFVDDSLLNQLKIEFGGKRSCSLMGKDGRKLITY